MSVLTTRRAARYTRSGTSETEWWGPWCRPVLTWRRTQSSVLVSRGRELVLQYKVGSPCPAPSEKEKRGAPIHDGAAYKHHSYADDEEEEDLKYTKPATAAAKEPERRKSATFAFLCDRAPTSAEAVVSFVGTPDECAYFFKVRSQHACARVETASELQLVGRHLEFRTGTR